MDEKIYLAFAYDPYEGLCGEKYFRSEEKAKEFVKAQPKSQWYVWDYEEIEFAD